MVIGGDHPLEGGAQDGSEDFGPAACGYGEIDHQGRNEDPKIAALPLVLPAGLINVEAGGIGKGLPDLLRHGFQLGADAFDAIAHASQAQVQAEEGVHDLHDASSADPVDRAEIGYGPMDSWLKLALCHLPRKLGPGLMAAGARQFMAAMFGHNRFDLRQLKSLVAQRRGGFPAAFRVKRSSTLLDTQEDSGRGHGSSLRQEATPVCAPCVPSGHLESGRTCAFWL